jgi:murein DD-endopeptidase MepM/ murein hydrolase activator NlpD
MTVPESGIGRRRTGSEAAVVVSRQWTVVIVPDDDAAVRQFRLTRQGVRVIVALALFTVAGLSSLATVFAMQVGGEASDSRVVVKNQLLGRELEYMATRLDTLAGSLDALARQDEHYRLLAGLDPLDPDVLLAGIGGPDGDDLESSDLYMIDERTGVRVFSTTMHLNSLIRRAGVLSFSWSEAEHALSDKHLRLAATPSVAPTRGRVSSPFSTSRWHPLLHRPRAHTGLDIVAAPGTPVIATARGRVVAAGNRGSFGLLVEIDHGHGTVTRYAHLSRITVKSGQFVQRGDNIGAVGNTGLSAGPHLHYEVLINGRFVDPSRYILDMDIR